MLKFLKCICLIPLLLPLACISHKQTCALVESAAPESQEQVSLTFHLPEAELDSPMTTEVEEKSLCSEEDMILDETSICDAMSDMSDTMNEVVDFDVLSEALGHFLVRNLKNPSFQFNLERIITGMQHENEGIPSPLSEEEYERKIAVVQEQIFLQNAEKNLDEANSFLENNIHQEGVKTLEDKLQYKIEVEGQGEEISVDSVPLIHYTGKLLDGTTFVNSHQTGEPIALALKQTIPGFSKGLVGMKEGEKRVLFIHPELAFGVSGYLPPNSLLIFEVELLKANNETTAVADASENSEMFDASFE